MKKLKIGITCYPTLGGSGVVATELGKKLAERGHEVHFITSSLPFRLETTSENIYYHEVEVNQYAVFRYPPYDLTLASKMAEVAQREALDLLHVHYAVPHAVCAYLAKQMVGGGKLKIVTTLHGTDITVLGYDPSLKSMIRFGIENSDCVTAVSRDLIRQTHELLETRKEIEPVHNFVDESVYYPHGTEGLRACYGVEEDEKVIVHISNYRAVKRVPDVVRTFAGIREKTKAKLFLVGEGPELPVAESLAKELGVRDSVKVLGKQDSVARLLSISDLVLLLSSKESFGLILLEAAACGVPAVGTSIGGIPEVIEEGETGYLVPVGDHALAAKRSLEILTAPEKQQKMGENALRLAESRFHSSKIVDKYEALYKKVLADE